MVRITSTGDIVNDEETPVRHRGPSRQSNNTISLRRNNGDIANTNLGHSNPWSVVNARLSEYGIPTYSLYGYKFEPIHFVFTLAALILFGVQSLLLIPILLIVSNLSNPSGSTDTARMVSERSQDSSRGAGDVDQHADASSGPFSGKGRKLGR
uniref:DUF4605 domain-containing protein n=1 Tax=Parascaris univalens TaxID=6257 RepID=A0A915BF87_PARUN